MFLNSLALRTKLSGDPTFLDLLSRVRDVTLGAYDHQELPFEKIVAELQPEIFAERSEEYAKRVLDKFKQAASAEAVECATAYVTSRSPSHSIVDKARAENCDLIVMASHGRRGLEGFLLGSETQKVLTHSTIPVLVYR